jgi:DNA-binding MarR family transcriptional regulator
MEKTMETLNLEKLTIQELKELIERANQQMTVLNQIERDRVAKEIIELVSEKNRLGKPIYTKSDVAELTGVSPSTVTKVIKEQEEKDNGQQEKETMSDESNNA